MPKLSANELAVLHGLHAAGMTNVPVKTICDYLPDDLAADRGGVSTRLCKMRGKNLVCSEMVGNINLWTINDAGMTALLKHANADIADQPDPVISEPIQPDSVDISVDISVDNIDPIAADFAAAIEAADEILAAELPEVDPGLVEEASRLRLRRPLPREQDALYVLSVLIDILGRDTPAMAYELTRIAAYIEGESA